MSNRKTASAGYGWIITEDMDDIFSGDDVGIVGPGNIDPSIESQLRAGQGRAFRMKDDDGEVYYKGRIIGEDSYGAGPLDDFGAPNAGCTIYEEYNNGWNSIYSSKKTALNNGQPNPQGSMVYSVQEATDQGYQEGFKYALTWTLGRPVPAAVTSSAQYGHKYNYEYVTGYREGLADGIASRDANVQEQWAKASSHQIEMIGPMMNVRANKRKAAKMPYRRRRTASEWNRNLNELDQTPSAQDWWGEHGGETGHGAANVANVPTPGASNSYPQPTNTDQDSAIGENAAEEWDGQDSIDKDDEMNIDIQKVEAFQRRVLTNLQQEARRPRRSMQRRADANSTMQKGKRIKDSARVQLIDYDDEYIEAAVLGDNGAYNVIIEIAGNGVRKIMNWNCTCKYYEFQGKHLCSHAYATYFDWQGEWGHSAPEEPIVDDSTTRVSMKQMTARLAQRKIARRQAAHRLLARKAAARRPARRPARRRTR